MSFADKIYAMEPRYRDVFFARAAAIEDAAPQLRAASGDRDTTPAKPYSITNGVAHLHINGTIFKERGWLEEYYAWAYGGTFTSDVKEFARMAASDPDVESVLIRVNSGGGDAQGLDEASDAIYELAQEKDVVAVVDGTAASAAYFMASAATEIVATSDSLLGSIGTYIRFVNYDKAMAKMGIEEIVIKSKQSPKKYPDETTKEGKAEFQQIVDALSGVFISAVARNRGVSESTVLSDYGQGGVFVGQAAVDAGLADRLGTYDEILQELQSGDFTPTAKGKASKPTNAAAQRPAKQENSMSLKDKIMALFAESEEPEGAAETPAAETKVTVKVGADTTEAEAALKALEDRAAAVKAETAKLEAAALNTRIESTCAALVSSGAFTPAAMEAEEGETAPLVAFAASLAAKDPALLDSFASFAATLPKADVAEEAKTLKDLPDGTVVVDASTNASTGIAAAVKAELARKNKKTAKELAKGN